MASYLNRFRASSSFANKSQFVSRNQDTISITNLSQTLAVKEFVLAVLEAKRQGYEEITIDLNQAGDGAYFPNVLVPISAFLDNIRQTVGINFRVINCSRNLRFTNFDNPQPCGLTAQSPSPLDRVWRFESSEDVFKLVTDYMDAIYKADVFEGNDVLNWLEWCLNEVMDNVIQHANAVAGYAMGQVHPHSKHIAFCIADAGRGIFESLRTSTEYWPKDAADALTLAMKEGVTRDRSVGQGNGLWGLHEVVRKSSGKLTLSSGGKALSIDEGGYAKYAPYLNSRKGGTVVDFQMNYSANISLVDILGGYHPESLKVFNAAKDGGETLNYRLSDQKSGFGTRKSGERIRNEILNLMQVSGSRVDIDFDGLGIVSSSFADELVAKLFVSLGPLVFSQKIGIINMNDTIAAIIDKAMQQRMIQEMTGNKNGGGTR